MRRSLFQATGVEIEYMIVSRETGRVLPLAECLLPVEGSGDQMSLDDRPLGHGIHASNELAAHVVEIKTDPPVADLVDARQPLESAVTRLNQELAGHQACLCPGGMHPFMDPQQEGKLWPHGCSAIYQAYQRIFDCRGHGWTNLQSTHLNFPFANDREFGQLHAAIILLLPILPALSASTPLVEGKATGKLNSRLAVYQTNQRRCPAIAGSIIPELVTTQADYQTVILEPSYRQIAPLDPEGLLQEEWLNSRGAIARFDRGAIEIRVLDCQECPRMDLAIAALIQASLRRLTALGEAQLRSLLDRESLPERVHQYQQVVTAGLQAPLTQPSLTALHQPGAATTVGAWWQTWSDSLELPAPFRHDLQWLFEEGNLAERILRQTGPTPSPQALVHLVHQLAHCLHTHQPFTPDRKST